MTLSCLTAGLIWSSRALRALLVFGIVAGFTNVWAGTRSDDEYVWTGQGGDSGFSNPGNWQNGRVPPRNEPGTTVCFSSEAKGYVAVLEGEWRLDRIAFNPSTAVILTGITGASLWVDTLTTEGSGYGSSPIRHLIDVPIASRQPGDRSVNVESSWQSGFIINRAVAGSLSVQSTNSWVNEAGVIVRGAISTGFRSIGSGLVDLAAVENGALPPLIEIIDGTTRLAGTAAAGSRVETVIIGASSATGLARLEQSQNGILPLTCALILRPGGIYAPAAHCEQGFKSLHVVGESLQRHARIMVPFKSAISIGPQSAGLPWNPKTLLLVDIGPGTPGTLRFGTDAHGLTSEQQAAIRIVNGGWIYGSGKLDDSGYVGSNPVVGSLTIEER